MDNRLDFSGLSHYDDKIKDYIDSKISPENGFVILESPLTQYTYSDILDIYTRGKGILLVDNSDTINGRVVALSLYRSGANCHLLQIPFVSDSNNSAKLRAIVHSVNSLGEWTTKSYDIPDTRYVSDLLSDKQDTLISGQNIKTVDNNSLIGNGNIDLGIPTKTSDLTNDGDGTNNFVTVGDLATDTTVGVVKTNPSESVTLNANGQLDVGGRLGAFSGTTGIFHSKDRQPRNVQDYSFLITDAIGMNLNAPRCFALATGVNITLTGSHSAGSTTYTVTNNYSNRIACAVLANGGYLSQSEAYSKGNQIVQVTSVKINGANYTPSSAANDNSKPITITVASSANPTSAVTQLRAFGGITGGYCSEYIGQCVGGASGASLIIGQRVGSPSGNVNCIVAADTYNTGNGNAIFGRQHISRKNRGFLAGTGHDTTNARSESVAAFGEWSDLSSTETLFAVGDGTSHIDRSNAFEVRDKSIVLKSANGTKWKIAVDNSGNLTTTAL